MVILLSYLTITLAAQNATSRPVYLGFRVEYCDNVPCVTWIMPGSDAWFQGAEVGSTVLSLDGKSAQEFPPGLISSIGIHRAEIRNNAGQILSIERELSDISETPAKFFLWALGAMFAVLGSAVLLRRPDLSSARWFAFFAGVAAAGLAVGPASGGPQPYWAVAGQALTLIGLGSSSYPFVNALVSDQLKTKASLVPRIFIFGGVVILVGYGLSLSVAPSSYVVVRPAIAVYMALSLLGAIVLLTLTSVRPQSPMLGLQSRIALLGIGLGTTPFIGLTLIPQAFGRISLVLGHISVLAVGLIPVAFAYAILQYNLLGIRTLVHRGMVYGLTTGVTLGAVAIALVAVASLAPSGLDQNVPLGLIALLVTGGVVIFFPMRRGARWLIDKLFYGEVVQYEEFVDVLKGEELTSDQTPEVIKGIANRLVDVLQLESAVLYLGDDPSNVRPATYVGPRAEDVVKRLYPLLINQIRAVGDRDMADLRWEGDSLLILNLKSSGRLIGSALLGPKLNGDVFVEEEKRLVATVGPLLALTVEQSILSSELRDLNQRLLHAQEQERARVAVDLHDGPLQKAIMLARTDGYIQVDPTVLARELVSELREIGSRLRPSILDDLGLVSAIDWLMDAISKRTPISTNLVLRGVTEDERFHSERELALFRIAQEATNNAVKHSDATRIDISLSRDDNELTLEVSDDGVGFSTATAHRTNKKEGGVGLGGMRERIIHLDGTFEITSAPGYGTKIEARIPIADKTPVEEKV